MDSKHGRDTGRRTMRLRPRVVVAVAGLVAAALAGGARAPVAHASFPGMNGRIALQDLRSIATMNPDGSGLNVIATPASGFTFANAAWSPHGTEVAFDDGDGIWIVEADGSNPRKVASIPSATHPSWSPDGSRIAYKVSNTVEVIDLADPTARTVLLAPPTVAEVRSGPSWSPTGAEIAVAALSATAAVPTSGIAIVDLSGKTVRFVTPSGVPSVSDLWPDWSPDGTRIVFVRANSNFPASRDVYTVAANGGSPPQDLTPTHPDRFSHPTWSPDGTLIAAVTSIAGFDIWTISASNGSDLTRLTFSDETDMPSWGPFTTGPESASATVPAGGTVTTDTEADGATPSDPVETSVTTPNPGTVSISEVPAAPSPTAFSFLGWQVNITAPVGSVSNPLVLVFRLDASQLPASPPPLQVFRNGSQVPDCTGAAGVAQPDPCVASRAILGDGDLVITVLSSAASRWTFAMPLDTPGEVEADELRPQSGGEASFEVESEHGRLRGELRFEKGSNRLRSQRVTALSIAADHRSAWIAGLGDDGRTFLAYVEDNHRKEGPDVFRLWIKGVSVTGNGALAHGDVRIEGGRDHEGAHGEGETRDDGRDRHD